RVAEIPRRRRAVVHGAVVPLGAPDDGGVALGVEEALGLAAAGPGALGEPLAEEVPEHRDRLVLAGAVAVGDDGAAVEGGVGGERQEAGVAPARRPRQLGVLRL